MGRKRLEISNWILMVVKMIFEREISEKEIMDSLHRINNLKIEGVMDRKYYDEFVKKARNNIEVEGGRFDDASFLVGLQWPLHLIKRSIHNEELLTEILGNLYEYVEILWKELEGKPK